MHVNIPQGRAYALYCFVLLFAECAHVPADAKETVTTFDPSGSTGTYAYGINDSGTIVGNYIDRSANVHGYLRTADGTITPFDVSGSTWTSPVSINSDGAVTGNYEGASSSLGFLRAADGTITTFAVTGSTITASSSINDRGAIAGWYVDNVNYGYHGFVRTTHGKITTFDVPESVRTYALSVNDSGKVAGFYIDDSDIYHGFLRAVDGTITIVDPPGSIYTIAQAIDREGTIAGWYNSKNGSAGFLRTSDGTYTTFGSGTGVDEFNVIAMNRKDAVTGSYQSSARGWMGFERLADGTIKKIRAPGAHQTYPQGINTQRWIAGYFTSGGYNHGFVATP